jgi:arylsulfatase A-like enzyme
MMTCPHLRDCRPRRFSRLGRSFLAACVLVILHGAVHAQDASLPPNILLVLVDDLRYDTLGYAGNQVIKTPNVDRLAHQGVSFSNAFCTTSICATSRATFLTGQYARRHGIHAFRASLSHAAFARTFPALLRAKGYRTGFVGKWGLGGALPRDEYDFFKGFSGQGRYFQEGRAEHLTRVLESQSLEFLDGCDSKKPFCLQVSFKAAHCQDGDPWPFQPDAKYKKLYSDDSVPVPAIATDEVFRALPEFLRDSEARRRWHVRFENPALYQKSVKDYYRLITGVDEALGKLIAKLVSKGLAGNTVIVFTSDNGFYLGERGLAGKWFMHEESIRLPLVIYDPRAPKSRRGVKVTEMALTIDLAPTLTELAGATPPKSMQGRSLVPLLHGDSPKWRDAWFYEHLFSHKRIPRSEGVRTTAWKYVNFLDMAAPLDDKGKPLGDSYEQLYHLTRDPAELQNLAYDPRHRADLEKLRARWRTLKEDAR